MSEELEAKPSLSNISASFTHLRQSETFLRGSFGEKFRTMVGEKGALGVRFSLLGFAVEYYTTDQEPKLSYFQGCRLVIWDRIFNTDRPIGWSRMLASFKLAPSAIVDLYEEKYWLSWTKTFRQYRVKWETQHEYEILAIPEDVFSNHYKKLGRPRHLASISAKLLHDHMCIDKERVRLSVLRRIHDGEIVAGIAIVDAPEVNQSYYLVAFTDKTTAPPQAGLWLLNSWFMECKNKGIRFANLGVLWSPGQPKGWKGFSEFKMHFRPYVLHYGQPLFRFTFSLKRPIGEQTNEKAQG